MNKELRILAPLYRFLLASEFLIPALIFYQILRRFGSPKGLDFYLIFGYNLKAYERS